MDIVNSAPNYASQGIGRIDVDQWSSCLTLHPGFQLRCMELDEPRNVAVDFQRNCPFLEFGCLVSGRLRGQALLGNGQKQQIEGQPGQTWCSFCPSAKGTIEYFSGQTVCVVLFVIYGPLLKNLPLLSSGRRILEIEGQSFNCVGSLTPVVNKVVRQIRQLNEGKDTINQLLFMSKAYELLFHLSRHDPAGGVEEDLSFEKQQSVKQAQDILNRNLASPPSLEELARQTGLCVTNLTEEFKKQSGTTVFGYLRRQRLARARELIALHDMSASEAAWEVGYSSLSSFHRAFCALYGATPGSFSPKE
ncbi:AraC family transcriptional regulator [uncultured Desulfobacter sp.]|uniref:helix-turn-helix domain-containing protein n=1 Tax=uncultured Desulfobacter sp. TaxID=240139 RepID=UPI002AA837C4|nr:AraC family transcriptional regulator [uncultured Desulfobacter sp.]